MTTTKLGDSVVLIGPDALRAGPSLASGFSSSTFRRSDSRLSLSLESYGATDVVVPLEVFNFNDEEGNPLISFLLIREELPQGTVSCAVHGILNLITSNAAVDGPAFSLFVPTILPFPNTLEYRGERRTQKLLLNDESGARSHMFIELAEVPGDLKIKDEFTACLVHLLRVTRLPTAMLVVPFYRVNRLDGDEIAREKHQVVKTILSLGCLLAEWLGLEFSSDLKDKQIEDSCLTIMEPHWRTLYT